MADALQVSVISPERTVFEGAADQVVASAWDGEVGILRGHAPMLVLLGEGEVRIRSSGRDQRFHIAGGFLQVADDHVTILSEHAAAH
ncbi:MAG: F0F1 ATP synthase subunit epsilon [Longimicrobiales bacterium]